MLPVRAECHPMHPDCGSVHGCRRCRCLWGLLRHMAVHCSVQVCSRASGCMVVPGACAVHCQPNNACAMALWIVSCSGWGAHIICAQAVPSASKISQHICRVSTLPGAVLHTMPVPATLIRCSAACTKSDDQDAAPAESDILSSMLQTTCQLCTMFWPGV